MKIKTLKLFFIYISLFSCLFLYSYKYAYSQDKNSPSRFKILAISLNETKEGLNNNLDGISERHEIINLTITLKDTQSNIKKSLYRTSGVNAKILLTDNNYIELLKTYCLLDNLEKNPIQKLNFTFRIINSPNHQVAIPIVLNLQNSDFYEDIKFNISLGINQLTNDQADKTSLKLSNGNIVWQHYDNSSISDVIYLYNLNANQSKKIIADPAGEIFYLMPVIEGNYVACLGRKFQNNSCLDNLYLYNTQTNTLINITKNSVYGNDIGSISIKNGKIAWVEYLNNDFFMRIYDINSAGNPKTLEYPVAGDIETDDLEMGFYYDETNNYRFAWRAKCPSTGEIGLGYYDSKENKAKYFCNPETNNCSCPKIFKNNIAWSNNYRTIFFMDITTNKISKVPLPENIQYCIVDRVYEDKILFTTDSGFKNNNSKICTYDFTSNSTKEITLGASGKDSPDMQDKTLAWLDNRTEYSEVYLTQL